MSSSHLGRNPFSQKSKPQNPERGGETSESHEKVTLLKEARFTQKNSSWAHRILIDLPARSIIFALKTVLQVKEKLD